MRLQPAYEEIDPKTKKRRQIYQWIWTPLPKLVYGGIPFKEMTNRQKGKAIRSLLKSLFQKLEEYSDSNYGDNDRGLSPAYCADKFCLYTGYPDKGWAHKYFTSQMYLIEIFGIKDWQSGWRSRLDRKNLVLTEGLDSWRLMHAIHTDRLRLPR
jgi:hypothetical protein